MFGGVHGGDERAVYAEFMRSRGRVDPALCESEGRPLPAPTSLREIEARSNVRAGFRTFKMDASLIEELITKNKPFKIETASGRIFEVPHRDFVSFSTRKTSLIVSYDENGTEHFAIVPLLTITSAMAPA